MDFQINAVLEPRGVPVAEAASKPIFLMDDLKKKGELSLAEAAFYLGIAKQTLYNWKSNGTRPRAYKDHRGRVYFLRVELDRFKKENSKVA